MHARAKILASTAIFLVALLIVTQHSSGQSWVQLSNTPGRVWWAASSADGTSLALGSIYQGPVFASTNSGATWTTNFASDSYGFWRVACSADGTKVVAAVGHPLGGPIFTSADSGMTWSAGSETQDLWHSIASSADGTKLVAVGELIYTSTDSGASWVTNWNAPNTFWLAVTSSADGTKLAAVWAVNDTGGIYLSSDSGVTWAPGALPAINWYAVGSSADGTRLIAGSPNGPLLTSTNSGTTWVTNVPVANWWNVASSANGTTLAAASYSGLIYISTNSGITWFNSGAPVTTWNNLAMSADGNKLVAVEFGGAAYIWQVTPAPVLNVMPSVRTLSLSWVVPSEPFELQQARDLSGTGWVGVAERPVLNFTNLRYQISLSLSNTSGFYRLARP